MATLSVIAQAAHQPGEILVICEHGPTVSIAAERFGRKKAGGSCRCNGPEPRVAVRRAQRLRGIIEHKQILVFCNRCNALVIRWLAEKIDRYDSLGAKAKLSSSSTCTPKAFRIQVEAGVIHIGKYGCGLQESNDPGRSGEGEARTDHRISRADALGHKHHQEGIGSA